MSYFQSFHFSIFSFPDTFFRKTLHFRSSALLNVLFPKFSFFDFFFFTVFFFSKFHSFLYFFLFIFGVFLIVCFYFLIFHFFIFSFPEAFFSQNAAFPEFCDLECLFSKVFIFRFLLFQILFFAKRCISGVLRSGMSYFQSFHF